MVDVFNGYSTFYTHEDFDLMNEFEENKSTQSMVKVWYFAITTLTTIGFGDFKPISVVEKMVIAFVMLFGVTIFSYIMGMFIEILVNYKSFQVGGDHQKLNNFILLLSKFTRENRISKDVITQIEQFFDFYWENNP